MFINVADHTRLTVGGPVVWWEGQGLLSKADLNLKPSSAAHQLVILLPLDIESWCYGYFFFP